MSESNDSGGLTVDEALALLPDRDRIHTRLGPIGCDWPRAELEDVIRAAPSRRLAGSMARALGDGLAVEYPRSRSGWLFVETTPGAIEALEAARGLQP